MDYLGSHCKLTVSPFYGLSYYFHKTWRNSKLLIILTLSKFFRYYLNTSRSCCQKWQRNGRQHWQTLLLNKPFSLRTQVGTHATLNQNKPNKVPLGSQMRTFKLQWDYWKSQNQKPGDTQWVSPLYIHIWELCVTTFFPKIPSVSNNLCRSICCFFHLL